jgi:hypothetical protein
MAAAVPPFQWGVGSLGLSCARPCQKPGVGGTLNPANLCLQVVVDTAEAGKALLARGRLRSRVTLIPLDKVRASSCPCTPQRSATAPHNAVLFSRRLRVT